MNGKQKRNGISNNPRKINAYIKLGLFMLLISWLMTGLSVDDEDYKIFLKHKPSLKYYYRSPLGMQDIPADYPTDLLAKQFAYDEFVLQKQWSDNYSWLAHIWLFINAVLLIIGLQKWINSSKTFIEKQAKYD